LKDGLNYMSKINVVIPAAGLGSRFAAEGYKLPKPLIDVAGKSMIRRVVESLDIDGNYIFIVQRSHCEEFGLEEELRSIKPSCTVIQIDGQTEGAACTFLKAREHVDNFYPMVLANSDQIFTWVDKYDNPNNKEFLHGLWKRDADGAILTFESTETKWSYVRLEENRVVEVAEKKPISNRATVGVYYFRHGRMAVWACDEMIYKNKRVNQEFYFAPCYSELIDRGARIIEYPVAEMWGTGTPDDLRKYLKSL
jgi:dTDP-glucose pyrophosphorylase